jgi:predicted transcriptional regulator
MRNKTMKENRQTKMRQERLEVLKEIYVLVDEKTGNFTSISEIHKTIREKDLDKEKTAISMLVSLLMKQKYIVSGEKRGSYQITQNGIDVIKNNGYYKHNK